MSKYDDHYDAGYEAYIDGIHRDIADLQAENDKLRERVHELEIEYDGATTAVLEKTERIEWIAGRLRGETNENDRLRELVRDMYAAFVHGNCYRWCEFKEPCNYISDGKCQWYDRMAELGVEVES